VAQLEDDPTFDVRHHVRHVGVPAPGDDATFHALVDTVRHPRSGATALGDLSDRRTADGQPS
jgi:hypothetical protein